MTADTKHIIRRDTIEVMKDGVIILNTSRGALIDSDDLADGLKSGKIGGAALCMQMEKQARQFGAEIKFEDVVSLDTAKKEVTTKKNVYSARAVIVATGAKPRSLGIDGEEKFRGRGVSYCATCDGMFFRGKQVFVIGGGNSACEEALFLSDIASSVTIVLRRDQFRAPEGVVNKVLSKDNITVRYQTSIVELSGEAMPTTITFKDNATGEMHTESFEPGSFGIFVFTGTQPHTELVEHLVDLAPDGGIVTDDSMTTRTPGLFAAGDIRSKRLRQVVTAVSDGAIAATSAYAFLRA